MAHRSQKIEKYGLDDVDRFEHVLYMYLIQRLYVVLVSILESMSYIVKFDPLVVIGFLNSLNGSDHKKGAHKSPEWPIFMSVLF